MFQIFGQETQQTISEWALATFGDVATTRSILTRANCELAELVHAIECNAPLEKIAAEIADVVIVLCRYPVGITEVMPSTCGSAERALLFGAEALRATVLGMALRVEDVIADLRCLAHQLGIDLPAAIDAKMKINRGRTWVSKGAGHGQHTYVHPTADLETLRLAAEYKASYTTFLPDGAQGAAFDAARDRHAGAIGALLGHIAGDDVPIDVIGGGAA